jgi:nicotinate-nucleotide adenylyltransferase
MNKKVGIFGGSFNPIHNGHISLARQLRQLAQLDEVWLMVSPQNPWKQQAALLDDDLRLQMARMALQHEEGIVASDYEFGLPRPSYTWNTLQRLQADYPDHQFSLLIGGDNWARFSGWYHADDILQNYSVVVYPRRGSSIDRDVLPPNVMIADTRLLDISSTDIRQRVRQGRSIRRLVPAVIEPLVRQYYRSASI